MATKKKKQVKKSKKKLSPPADMQPYRAPHTPELKKFVEKNATEITHEIANRMGDIHTIQELIDKKKCLPPKNGGWGNDPDLSEGKSASEKTQKRGDSATSEDMELVFDGLEFYLNVDRATELSALCESYITEITNCSSVPNKLAAIAKANAKFVKELTEKDYIKKPFTQRVSDLFSKLF